MGNQGVHHLFENLKQGDYIWTRSNGKYYVAQVHKSPSELFYFDVSEEAAKSDCSAQLKDISWVEVGKEESVPGAVSTFTSNMASIFKIDNYETTIWVGDTEYSVTSLFSSLAIGNRINFSIENKKMLFKLIGPSNAEDLVALWLFDKFNYITIPSTNKTGTQLYEFVLVDATKNFNGEYANNRNIYIQVKNGDGLIQPSKYLDILRDEIDELWLISTLGSIGKIDSNEIEPQSIVRYRRIAGEIRKEFFEIENLIDFALNKSNNNILPKSISKWQEFFDIAEVI
jgi:hypothetical protein